MTISRWTRLVAICALCSASLLMSGCGHYELAKHLYQPPEPQYPVGKRVIDPIWRMQEANAEASKFVVHMHEFGLEDAQLNWAGMDHVKQIAVRLRAGQDFPVVIERSLSSAKEGTEYQYRVHPNPELDMERREVIVRSLSALGVPHADERVVVSPAFTPGYMQNEAEQAYNTGYSGSMGSGGSGRGIGNVGNYGGFGGGFF